MMTALIKMEQIEKGRLTMELCNYLPRRAFVLTAAFSPRQIDRREEERRGGEETRNKDETRGERRGV